MPSFVRLPELSTRDLFSDKNNLNDLEGRSRSSVMARFSQATSLSVIVRVVSDIQYRIMACH